MLFLVLEIQGLILSSDENSSLEILITFTSNIVLILSNLFHLMCQGIEIIKFYFYVSGPPYIRTMGEISAVAGETLRVTCPVAGFPIDNIKWYRGTFKK